MGWRILNCTEPHYPQSLRQIYDRPALRYLRGDVGVLHAPSLRHRGNPAPHRRWHANGGTPGPRPRLIRKSASPNQLIKLGAKPVTSADDVAGAADSIRAALLPAEAVESEERNALAARTLNPTEQNPYTLLNVEEPRHIDDLVGTTGLNSSEVLATLFKMERKGVIRELPGSRSEKCGCECRKARAKSARCI
jgi:predicted Rossmann fold nucleotide-binding protein DprA/Smf involved in DNA uptake